MTKLENILVIAKFRNILPFDNHQIRMVIQMVKYGNFFVVMPTV